MGAGGRDETAATPPGLRFGPRDLVRLNPVPPGQHRVALRAGLSVAVPLLLVVLLDRTPWAVYAAFGAFASLYGRNHVHLPRAVMQATSGLALVGAVALGAVLAAVDAGPWTVVLATAGLSAVGSLTSTALDWHPSGPLFMVFALGTVAAAPGDWSDVPVAVAVSSASAAFAVVVGGVGAVARRTTRQPPRRLRSPWSVDAVRYAVAVAVAGAVATAAGIGHPWWAMVAAAAPLSVRGRDHQVLRAGHRIAGTSLGLVTAGPLLLLDLAPVPLVLVVVALQIVTELLVGRNYALALLFITPMALLMGQLGSRPAARPRGRDADRRPGRDRAAGGREPALVPADAGAVHLTSVLPDRESMERTIRGLSFSTGPAARCRPRGATSTPSWVEQDSRSPTPGTSPRGLVKASCS